MVYKGRAVLSCSVVPVSSQTHQTNMRVTKVRSPVKVYEESRETRQRVLSSVKARLELHDDKENITQNITQNITKSSTLNSATHNCTTANGSPKTTTRRTSLPLRPLDTSRHKGYLHDLRRDTVRALQ